MQLCGHMVPCCLRTANGTLQIGRHTLGVHHISVAVGVLLIPAFNALHHILDVLINVKSGVLLTFS